MAAAPEPCRIRFGQSGLRLSMDQFLLLALLRYEPVWSLWETDRRFLRGTGRGFPKHAEVEASASNEARSSSSARRPWERRSADSNLRRGTIGLNGVRD